jgi:hypothetical protein
MKVVEKKFPQGVDTPKSLDYSSRLRWNRRNETVTAGRSRATEVKLLEGKQIRIFEN